MNINDKDDKNQKNPGNPGADKSGMNKGSNRPNDPSRPREGQGQHQGHGQHKEDQRFHGTDKPQAGKQQTDREQQKPSQDNPRRGF